MVRGGEKRMAKKEGLTGLIGNRAGRCWFSTDAF